MEFLIVFSTRDGHTRKLADFVGERLVQAGHGVRISDAGLPGPPAPAGCDAAILAAPVLAGRFPRSIRRYARANHAALNAIPSALISVSLSAAGDIPGDWDGLGRCVADLARRTRWHPVAVHHAAGAMPFTRYGFVTRHVIAYIARRHGRSVELSRDYDLTDYEALAAFVVRFAAGGR